MLNKTDTGTTPPLRIFLVGVPRSGTTLLQSMLAAHPDVASFTESHFFSTYFRYSKSVQRYVLTQDPSDRVRKFLEENGVDRSALGAVPRIDEGWPAGDEAAATAHRFICLLDHIAAARGKPAWLEKTPDHLQILDLIEAAARYQGGPGRTRFLHIVRKGPDVVGSLRTASKAWGDELSIEQCVRKWNDYMKITHSRVGSPIDHVVFYEDLVAAPEPVLHGILEFLNLPWSPKVLSDYAAAAGPLIAKDEHWKANNRGVIAGRKLDNAALGVDEERFVRDHLILGRYARLRKRVSGRSLMGMGDSLRRLARRLVS